MRGQIEIFDLANPGDLAGDPAEQKRLAGPGRLQPPSRRIRVRVTDEENRLAFVPNHPHGQVVGGRILAHHSGGDYEHAASTQFHYLRLCLVEHDQVESFTQLQGAVLAVCAMGLQVVYLSENSAQSTDVNGL